MYTSGKAPEADAGNAAAAAVQEAADAKLEKAFQRKKGEMLDAPLADWKETHVGKDHSLSEDWLKERDDVVAAAIDEFLRVKGVLPLSVARQREAEAADGSVPPTATPATDKIINRHASMDLGREETLGSMPKFEKVKGPANKRLPSRWKEGGDDAAPLAADDDDANTKAAEETGAAATKDQEKAEAAAFASAKAKKEKLAADAVAMEADAAAAKEKQEAEAAAVASAKAAKEKLAADAAAVGADAKVAKEKQEAEEAAAAAAIAEEDKVAAIAAATAAATAAAAAASKERQEAEDAAAACSKSRRRDGSCRSCSGSCTSGGAGCKGKGRRRTSSSRGVGGG